MPAAVINENVEMIREIKEKVSEISRGDNGTPINLDNIVFREPGKTGSGNKIFITCLFINEDGNVCADMYRSGSAGCVDFICGLDLNSADEKILKEIKSALAGNKWSVSDYPEAEKNKKRNPVSSFKIPFLQKGA